jgi:hypothetical protein
MAVTYGFFNSVNGDRKYNADQMSEYFRGIVSQGVFQHLDSGMAVSAGTGLSVSVAAGRAIIQNRWVQNSAALNLTISDASETYGRKDAVVIRLNKSSRAISIAVKTGTPAASPVAPSMTRDETTYEMALAYVNVAAGASSVTVTDKRSDSSVCGWASVAQATSGEVDQMLNDMKTGFDGVVYSSPAAMVQGCDTLLNDKIESINGRDIPFAFEHGYISNGSDSVYWKESRIRTTYPVKLDYPLVVSAKNQNDHSAFCIVYYNDDLSYSSTFTWGKNATVPANLYFRLVFSLDYTTNTESTIKNTTTGFTWKNGEFSILDNKISDNKSDIDAMEDILDMPVSVDATYSTFDANNTSTFTKISDGNYTIKYTTPSGSTDVPGIKCVPDSTSIMANGGKTLLVNIETNYTKPLSVFIYGTGGYAYSIGQQGSGTVRIDLANLLMYYTKLSYIVVGAVNPDVNDEWTEKISFEFDEYRANPYYSSNLPGTMNSIGNELAALKSQLENDYTTLIKSPNGTIYKLRVNNSGVLSASSVVKEIGSAVFFGNSLLVSNGGSGMCASSPEYDYFARVCAFLHSKNSALVYHVWTDEIDGTETAIKAQNFAGVFEDLTTVAAVEAFLPTLDVYLDEDPDYISIQLGDNSSQDVEFFTKTSLAMLLDYCHTKCPNALIVVMGAWYTTPSMISGMAETVASYGDIFVNFQGVRSSATQSHIGATVTYPDRTTHEITNAGVASHPNDDGFEGIANLVIEAISPFVQTVS